MYVILVNDDNTLTASRKERIMQRSKLVDNLWFLVPPIYKEEEMAKYTVTLEYVLPVSRKYCSETLVLSEQGYEEYLKYLLPFDTKITNEAGKVEMQLTFTSVDFDANGNQIQRVRKTSVGYVDIIPISAWSDIIPDSALSALDQRLIKLDAQTKCLEAYADIISENQVDNLKYDDNMETLQLMSGDKAVGDAISVRDMLDEGIPVVDLNSSSGSNGNNNNNNSGCGCNCNCEDNVVEFDKCECDCDCDENVVKF